MTRYVPVLLTCVGGTLSAETIRALKASDDPPIRVIGVDASPDIAVRPLLDRCVRVPPGGAPDYLPAVLDIVRQERIRAILPGSDEEAEALAGGQAALMTAGATPCVPPLSVTQRLRDKAQVMRALTAAGLTMPGWREVRTLADLADGAAALGYPRQPLVLKPCTGRGGRGALVLETLSRSSGLSLFSGRGDVRLELEAVQALLRRLDDWPPMLLMEYLPGPAYDVDVVADHGRLLQCAVRRRVNPRGIPFLGCTTEDAPRIEAKVTALTETLGLHAGCDVDLATGADGEPQVLEVNPRMSGSVAGAISAGLNVPVALVRQALGLPVPEARARHGITTLPYTKVVHESAAAALAA